jgi:DNA-binding transcriptional LysR family regulator
MLEAGVGLMLMRDEHVRQGLEQGSLAVSPIAIAEIPLMMAHLASRSLDPLIVAFLQIAREVWPQMRPAQSGI